MLAELEGLDPTSVLVMKKLIKAGMADQNDPDAVNLRESYGAFIQSWQHRLRPYRAAADRGYR